MGTAVLFLFSRIVMSGCPNYYCFYSVIVPDFTKGIAKRRGQETWLRSLVSGLKSKPKSDSKSYALAPGLSSEPDAALSESGEPVLSLAPRSSSPVVEGCRSR